MAKKMTQRIRSIINKTIAKEGGYVYDKNDLGGETNIGITIHTARKLGLDLNNDGVVDGKDIKLITHDIAFDIYANQYYFDPKIDGLLPQIQDSVFDMFVNSGGNAIKVLQRLVNARNRLDKFPLIKVDGVLGEHTTSEANRIAKRNPPVFRDAYGLYRVVYYIEISIANVKQQKYTRGWINRANSYIRKAHQFDLGRITDFIPDFKGGQ